MGYIGDYPLSAAFYILIMVITCTLSSYADKHNKKASLVFIVVFLTCVAGFRDYRVGIDTTSYISFVENINARGNLEPLFRGLIYLTHVLGMDRFLLIILAGFTYGFFFAHLWHMRGRVSIAWAAFVFLSLFYFETFNIMRQMLAMSIVFYGTKWLEQHKYWKYAIYVVVASLFHMTAILSIIMIYFDMLTWKTMPRRTTKLMKFYFVVTPIAFGVLLFFFVKSGLLNTIESKAYYFFNPRFNAADQGIGLMLFVKLFLIITIFLPATLNKIVHRSYRRRIVGNNLKISDDNTFAFWMISVSIGVLLSFIGYRFSNMDRIAYYYTMMQMPLYAVVIRKRKQYLSAKVLIVVVCVYTYFSYLSGSISNCMPFFY